MGVQAFTALEPRDLIASVGGREIDLIGLGQALARKFARETSVLLRSMEDVCKSLPALEAKAQGTSAGKPARGHGTVEELTAQMQEAHKVLRAVVVVQAAWRRRVARRSYDRYLHDLVFAESGRRLRQSGGSSHDDFGTPATQKATAVCAIVRKLALRLRRRGLDFEAAFRCADPSYPGACMQRGDAAGGNSALQHMGTISVGHLLVYLFERHGVRLLPAEVLLLRRLFRPPAAEQARLHHGGAPALGMAGAISEAFAWQITYCHACELAALCAPPPLSVLSTGASVLPHVVQSSKNALIEVRNVLAREGQELQTCWGRVRPSWRRVMLDAYMVSLQDELKNLSSERPEQEVSPTSNSSPSAIATRNSLALCAAELAGARKTKVERLATSTLVARLLQENLPVAAVTLHAAVHSVSESSSQRRSAIVQLKASSERFFVDFELPLPSRPELLHVCLQHQRLELFLTLEELDERGARIRAMVKDPTSQGPLRSGAKSVIRYTAVCVSGRHVIRHRDQENHSFEISFKPRLRLPPSCIVVESFTCDSDDVESEASAALPHFVVSHASSRGFLLGQRQSACVQDCKVKYEAVASESTVSISRLQEFAPLGPWTDEEHEDKNLQAAALPPVPPLHSLCAAASSDSHLEQLNARLSLWLRSPYAPTLMS